MKDSSKRGVHILRAAALVLGGAAAWIVLSSSHAGAITLVDQESETTNVGVAVANTGGNTAVGNASDNDSDVDQTATAIGGDDDTVAVNTASGGNSSSGSANISTGNAHATGNHSTTSNTQVVNSDGGKGGLTLVDQENTTNNGGLAIANTGFNSAVGNASDNDSDVDQTATAIGGADDTVAANFAGGSNHSSGTANIHTGNATAVGNHSTTHNVQVVDVDHHGFKAQGHGCGWQHSGCGSHNSGCGWQHGGCGSHNFGCGWQHVGCGSHHHGFGGLVLVDQENETNNFGFAFANTGINLAIGNGSTNNSSNVTQNAVAIGGDDAVAVNDAGCGCWSGSSGSAAIATGSAHATGNHAHNSNSQLLNVVATRPGSNSAAPLAVLLGMLFLAVPARKLATRRS